jgi:hypothetical protein
MTFVNDLIIHQRFHGGLEGTPFPLSEPDRLRSVPELERRSQALSQLISGISTPELQSNTWLTIINRLSVASQESNNLACMSLAHSIAMNTLQGKNTNVGLLSIAYGLIRMQKWEELIMLVKKRWNPGNDAIEFKLAIIQRLCEDPQPQVALSLELAEIIGYSRQTRETLALICIEQAKKGHIENAELIELILIHKYNGQTIFESISTSIYHAKQKAWCAIPQYEQRSPTQADGDIESGRHDLKTLRIEAQEFINKGMIDKLFAVVRTIANLDEDERLKNELIAELAVYLYDQGYWNSCMARFITHGSQDNPVDVKLVQKIAVTFGRREDLVDSFSIAEQYLKGRDLTDTFHEIAQYWFDNRHPEHYAFYSNFLPPIKEKGKWLVATVEVAAEKDVQKARMLIDQVCSAWQIQEEDLVEAYACIAKGTLLAKQKTFEEVFFEFAHNISMGKSEEAAFQCAQKAYSLLAEKLLNCKTLWRNGIDVMNHISPDIPREDLDRLLAKAAIAEAEAVIDPRLSVGLIIAQALENNPDY